MTSHLLTGRDPATGRTLAVRIANGRIAAVGPGPDGERAWLSAGLVDLQVNGYGGHDLNGDRPGAATVAALGEQMLRHGVTTFVPTLVTADEEALVERLRAIADARAADPRLRHAIPYVHVEGPSIQPEDGPRGAHPLAHVRPPSLDEFARWQQASGGLVGMVTVSPHWPDSGAYIAALVRQGVVVALGHTSATPEQIVAAVDAGASLSTHLGNGSHAMLPRHRNCLWAQLADDRLSASFIADGHHLPADALKAMVRAKTVDRSILVSDATSIGGLPPGDHTSSIGGAVHLQADGRLTLKGSDYLAGAAVLLHTAVARAVRMAQIGLPEALAMATRNPGRLVGGRGTLEVGAAADLIRFHWAPGDDSLRIDGVWASGCAVPAPDAPAAPPPAAPVRASRRTGIRTRTAVPMDSDAQG